MITTMPSDQNGPPPRVEVITSVQRRRRWPTAEKIRLVEETMQPGMSVSYVARRAGVAPSLLFNWRRRMLEGGLRAVEADEDVVGTSRVRELERRVRELERLLGRKTMEVEILKEALDLARAKKPILLSPRCREIPGEDGGGEPGCAQEQHDLANDLLLDPARDDPLGSLRAYPCDLVPPGRLLRDNSNTASPKACTSFFA